MPAELGDAGLRERLVAGDDDALAEAYDRWSSLVHTLAVRITADHAAADDITQDVFVYLWQCPHAYDPVRGTLRGWLCLLARRRALDWARRRQVRDRYAATVPGESAGPEVEDVVLWRAETKVVREAVRALPGPQRDAVLLAYYRGFTYRQVATELSIPEGTAKSRLRLALANLAERLDAEGLTDS
jgi:RNA polymerase sigma-70 factor (ECF subfamily)